MERTIAAALMTVLLGAAGACAQDVFKADPAHSQIGFAVKHLVISKVRGQFSQYEATLTLQEGALDGAQATIQVASIDTGNAKRDDHLRNEDFFHASAFPEITFTSTSVGDDEIVGDLTIRGVTKEVSLPYELAGPVVDPWGNTKLGFSAQLTINRKDFGVAWNASMESGEMVVGEEVEITIDAEFAKQ